MVNKGNIARYRERFDETLASDNLIDEKKLKALVRDQILRSSENTTTDYIDHITEIRAPEVSEALEMLRSASESYNASSHETHHTSWKLKQDTDDFRVMYREGPIGSPFHSLLVEGFIEAPLDVCMCVSWESALYPRWFPETLIPTFKVTAAKSLQKVRIGEEISLVRVKLSWPLSSREAVIHYFEFEYFEDDLVVVLLNTIPDADNIQMETHGFTSEGIPKADNTVRIDVVGGFALQKVTENRTYFRTIGNLDIKLDFVPPSLINFISRQLIGSAFRFYQKTVASVSNGDEAFAKALNGPPYSRIRQSLYANSKSEMNLKTQNIQDNVSIDNGKHDVQKASRKEDMKVLGNGHVNKIAEQCKSVSNEIEEEEIKENNGDNRLWQGKPVNEIEEEEMEGSKFEEVKNITDGKECFSPTNQTLSVNAHNYVSISPQVEKALGTLDKMINVVKEKRTKGKNCSQLGPEIGGGEAKYSSMGNHVELVDKQDTTMKENDRDTAHVLKNGATNGLRSENSEFHAQEATSYVISSDQNPAIAGNSPAVASPMNLEVNGIHENNKKTGQPKKWRLCCFHLASGRLVS